MAPKPPLQFQHPLDQFLAQDAFDNPSMLELLARKYAAEPFNADSFKRELTTKLRRLRYQQGSRTPDATTFHEALQHAGALSVLLGEDTLRELWKSVLLKKIFGAARNLKQNSVTVEGISLADQRGKVRKVQKDFAELERIANEYGLTEMAPVLEEMAGKVIDAWRPIFQVKRPGSKEELLTGRPRRPKWRGQSSSSRAKWFPFGIRNEDTAIQVLIFRTLKSRLRNRRVGRNSLPDSFLYQLSELIWAEPHVTALGNGEAVRKAIERPTKRT